MGYYSVTHSTVEEIGRRWLRGDKIYDMSMPVMIPLDNLAKYLDYNWTRDTARGGRGQLWKPDAEQPRVSGPEKCDQLMRSMQEFGWSPEEPAMLTVAKDGTAKLGEGNHRFAIAKHLGIKEVPVRIFFNDQNYQTSQISRPPTRIESMEFKKWLV